MAQTTKIELEYLMTIHADLAAPLAIDTASRIVNVTGGWVEGPKINSIVCTFLRSLPSAGSKQHDAITQPLSHGHSDAGDNLIFLPCCASQPEAHPVGIAYTAPVWAPPFVFLIVPPATKTMVGCSW
jgi:hypothetical protein